MAEIKGSFVDISEAGDRGAVVWTWTALTGSDTAAVLDLKEYEAVAIEFSGTFDSATVILQGSVLGTTYTTLKDTGGTNISQTAAAWQSIALSPRLLKVSASGGGGSQSLTITLLVRRKTAPLRS